MFRFTGTPVTSVVKMAPDSGVAAVDTAGVMATARAAAPPAAAAMTSLRSKGSPLKSEVGVVEAMRSPARQRRPSTGRAHGPPSRHDFGRQRPRRCAGKLPLREGSGGRMRIMSARLRAIRRRGRTAGLTDAPGPLTTWGPDPATWGLEPRHPVGAGTVRRRPVAGLGLVPGQHRDPAGVPFALAERRGQEHLDEPAGGLRAVHPGADADHVGVVVLAGQPGGLLAPRQRRPGATH